MILIFEASKLCTDICKTIFETLKHQFHHEAGLVQHRYFELFFSAWSIFSSYKRSAPNETGFTFFVICCNFGQFFCTNVIQFFSVENMGHNQLKKCRKYHLVSLLNEKQRSTFANSLHLFCPCPLLTNSALGPPQCAISRDCAAVSTEYARHCLATCSRGSCPDSPASKGEFQKMGLMLPF